MTAVSAVKVVMNGVAGRMGPTQRLLRVPIREEGFEGLVEIEIPNEALWSRDGNAAFGDVVCRALVDHVGLQERR